MKVSRNNTVYGLIGVLILFGLLATFGDFLPASGARTYEPTREQIEAQKIYDSISQDLELATEVEAQARATTQSAILAEQTATNARISIQTTLCAQQLVLGQIKYSNTDPEDTEEIARLTTSINNARACLGQPVTDF